MTTKTFMEKCHVRAHWFLTQTAWGKFYRKHRTAFYVIFVIELLLLFGAIELYRHMQHTH